VSSKPEASRNQQFSSSSPNFFLFPSRSLVHQIPADEFARDLEDLQHAEEVDEVNFRHRANSNVPVVEKNIFKSVDHSEAFPLAEAELNEVPTSAGSLVVSAAEDFDDAKSNPSSDGLIAYKWRKRYPYLGRRKRRSAQ
jgi:hypothetical protein